ncbi:MAG TPA: hypothetical protein QF710_02665 [Candidatus Nitrosopelagicus sp.]|jgi:hypothetical protein|nr:hypothetical protein [Candidatus Nitrosopelagicus sp.]
MKKHAPADEMRKDLENLLSRINALEVSAPDDYQKSLTKVLRILTEGQMHSVNEFEHLKKAIDLLTMQLFEAQNKINSKN